MWNINTNTPNKPAGEFIPSQELMKAFDEEPSSVSQHPSGLQVAVTFHSGLRLMNILMDDIRPYMDLSIKVCVCVVASLLHDTATMTTATYTRTSNRPPPPPSLFLSRAL